jgi:aminopeptidase N
MKKWVLLWLLSSGTALIAHAQLLVNKEKFTAADTLRGSLNPQRTWWNVLRYDLNVQPDFTTRTIRGNNTILFSIEQPAQKMQIDLQAPMVLDSIRWNTEKPQLLSFTRAGNVALVTWPAIPATIKETSITLYFSGKPVIAVRPPWDGGWIWTRDENGNPWISVACQGLGASVWYPCKDHQSDEPERGASLSMIIPENLKGIANGRLIQEKPYAAGTKIVTWEVKNPINSYNLVPYIGKYVNFTDTLQGEKGVLDLSYWVLENHLSAAKEQFTQTKPMLRAFEHWMGPYPFYDDSYKLVEAPHLGMEHQSAVAYGNKFMNGYLGMDLSETGWGLKWDYIIIHESGHEWFANNITSKDIADMWIHEGFTTYSETLFTEYWYGKQAGNEYNYGLRKGIENKEVVVGPYGVNKEGSGDMYPKVANMIHTLRHSLNDDSLFRKYLRDMNQSFYHRIVEYADIEQFTSKYWGRSVTAIFQQYLKTTQIPQLKLAIAADEKTLYYRWDNCVSGFDLPIWLPSNINDTRLPAMDVKWQQTRFSEKIDKAKLKEIEKLYYCTVQILPAVTDAISKEASQ